MAFKSKNFMATLDGTNASELSKKLDRNAETLQQRTEIVEDILKNTDFFIDYFTDYFEVVLTKDSHLSLDNNICNILETYATYLLNSNDVKREEKTQYKFYYDEDDFRRALLRENLYEENEDTIDFLLSGQENFKKEKTQKITAKDLRRNDWCGSVLRDYNNYLEFLNTIDQKGMKFKVDRIKGEVKKDMVLAKDKMLQVFGYNLRYFDESTEPSLEEVDFTNPQHLKGYSLGDNAQNKNFSKVDGLLQMKFNGDFQNDWQCILYDVDKLIEKTKLTDKQSEYISLYRKGYTVRDIAKLYDLNDSSVSRTIDLAIKKIANKAKELGYTSS